MEKIDYKAIVDAAIGEKPSLVKPNVLEFKLAGKSTYLHKADWLNKPIDYSPKMQNIKDTANYQDELGLVKITAHAKQDTK